MNIARKDIDSNNAVITVSITKDDYAAKVEKSLKDYRKKANMPGFRPGNVPIGLIKKMYGNAVKAEEVNNLISESLSNYIEEQNLSVLGQPLPSENEENKLDFETQDDFDFHFDIGLAPEFEVELSDKESIPYYEITISEEMINNQIKSYASRFGKYEQVEEADEKDMIKGNLVELENGTEKENGVKVENAVITPTDLTEEDQKTLFIGKKVGDVIVFNPAKGFNNNVKFSSLLKLEIKEVEGITSDFQFEITGITRYIESEINQGLFDKVYGEGAVNSEDEFKAKITENIKENLISDSEYKFNIDVREALINRYKDITFPDTFLKRWLLETNKEMTAETVETDYPKMVKDLTWHIIKDKIGKNNDIKVEFADVENYAKKVAKSQFAQYGMVGIEDDIINNYVADMLKKEENIRNFVDRATEDKIIEIIREKVKLDKHEVTIEEFNKMFEPSEQ